MHVSQKAVSFVSQLLSQPVACICVVVMVVVLGGRVSCFSRRTSRVTGGAQSQSSQRPGRALRWRVVERFRDGVAPRRDAGENVAELEDDIAAALSDIVRLAEESELYFQRSQEKTIYVLTTVTAIFLPLQFVTGLFGMNFKYMPQLNDRGAYYLLLLIMTIYTVLALLLVWWCSSGRRRSLKHHDIEAA